MSRFTRHPCTKCQDDTLHYVGKCVRCKTVTPVREVTIKRFSWFTETAPFAEVRNIHQDRSIDYGY